VTKIILEKYKMQDFAQNLHLPLHDEGNNTEYKLALLGIGSAKDREFKVNLMEALLQLGVDIPVQEVRDIDRLLAYGITGIPALIFNGRVVVQKVVPSMDDLRTILGLLFHARQENWTIRNIVVPTDFSATAQNAYKYALHMARMLGAKVRLVHVHPKNVDTAGTILLDGAPEELHYKQELLESWSITGSSQVGVQGSKKMEVVPEMIKGLVIEELRTISRRRDTDLIVMGATGENKLLGRFLGGISSEVARKAHCPVLLVPRNTDFVPFRKILYGCNYLAREGAMVARALQVAKAYRSELHLVHVVSSKEDKPFVQHLPIGGLDAAPPVFLSHVVHPDVLQGLSICADEHDADLLAMGTVHRPFFEDTFRRNLTREMAFQAHVPLLIFHAED
jgi:nucleotide-binding universal stress UspA family protein